MKTLSHINTTGSLSNRYIRIGLTIVGIAAAAICLLTLLHELGSASRTLSSLF